MRRVYLALFTWLYICSFSQAQVPQIELELVTDDLHLPVYATTAGDGSNQFYVVTLDGFIYTLENGSVSEYPFLDLTGRVTAREGEQGFYSLAFHPDYKENRRFFISYTEIGTGDVVVMEHKRSRTDPEFAVARTGKEILRFSPQVAFHHGGQLAFGPDGYLYISFGDGTGPLYEPREEFDVAQDLDTFAGKILRIDVDKGDPYSVPDDNPFIFLDWLKPEIYALGFRNPWKFSFDRKTDLLYTGDVGNYDWEEINIVEAGGNYGWPAREGPVCFIYPTNKETAIDNCDESERYLDPLYQYGHVSFDEAGGNAIVGGYVYRGEKIPRLQGYYLYGDFTNGRIWAMRHNHYGAQSFELFDADFPLTSFAEDDDGELYALFITGQLYKLSALKSTTTLTD